MGQAAERTASLSRVEARMSGESLRGGGGIEVEIRGTTIVKYPHPADTIAHAARERQTRLHLLEGFNRKNTEVCSTMYRLTTDGKTTFLVGGGFCGEQTIEASVQGRPGAKGIEVDSCSIDKTLFASFPYWTTVEASPSEKSQGDFPGMRLDEQLVPTGMLYAYHISAKPVSPDEIKAMVRKIDRERSSSLGRVRRSHQAAHEVREAAIRLDRLSEAGEGSGLWQATILVGARSRAELEEIAQTVAATSQSAHPEMKFSHSGTIVDINEPDAINRLQQQTCFLSTQGVEALTDTLPREVGRVHGFSMNWETPFALSHNIRRSLGQPAVNLAEVRDVYNNPAGDLLLPMGMLLGQVLVTGETRSGKSRFIDHLLTEISRYEGASWLILDPKPRNDEFSVPHEQVLPGRLATFDHLPAKEREVVHVDFCRKAEDTGRVPVSIDLFTPLPGYTYSAHIEKLVTLIVNTIGMPVSATIDTSEVPGLVDRYARNALQGVTVQTRDGERYISGIYEDAGIDIKLDRPFKEGASTSEITAQAFAKKCIEIIEAQGYGPEAEGTVQGMVKSALTTLFTGLAEEVLQPGEGYRLDPAKLFNGKAIVSYGDVSNEKVRALITGGLLMLEEEHAQTRKHTTSIPRIVVVEEIQDFLQKDSPTARELARQFRQSGERHRVYIGVAQNMKLVPDEIKGNTALKIALKAGGDDVQSVQEVLGLNDIQAQKMRTLGKGEAVVVGDRIPDAMRMQISHPVSLEPIDVSAASVAKVVEWGVDEKLYSRRTIIEAERMLDNTEEGRIITALAELLVPAVLFGQKGLKLTEVALTHLADVDIVDDILERALGRAAVRAIESRSEDIPFNSFPLKSYVAEAMRSLIWENTLPEQVYDLNHQNSLDALEPAERVGLFAPRQCDAIDRLVGVSLVEMVDGGKEKEWIALFTHRVLSLFALSDEQAAFVATAYGRLVEDIRTYLLAEASPQERMRKTNLLQTATPLEKVFVQAIAEIREGERR